MSLFSDAVEAAAQEMYAAGPWGTDHMIVDGGLRCLTDSHDLDVYRDLAAEAISHYIDALEADQRTPALTKERP